MSLESGKPVCPHDHETSSRTYCPDCGEKLAHSPQHLRAYLEEMAATAYRDAGVRQRQARKWAAWVRERLDRASS